MFPSGEKEKGRGDFLLDLVIPNSGIVSSYGSDIEQVPSIALKP